MAKQNKSSKPNFKSFKKVVGAKKSDPKIKAQTKKAKVKKPAKDHDVTFVTSGRGCQSNCGTCISCRIEKANEENHRRISDYQWQ